MFCFKLWSHERSSDDQNPSFNPTSPPHDSRRTLEIVRTRDEPKLKCGLSLNSANSFAFRNMTWDLCRAVASVVLGDPESFAPIPVTAEDRFIKLRDKKIDVLIWGDSYTLEREISEITSGTGFSFAPPYFHAGLVYVGKESYVNCTQSVQRYGDCSDLKICVQGATSVCSAMRTIFPRSFLDECSTFDEMVEQFDKGDCNVVACDLFQFLTSRLYDEVQRGDLYFTDDTLSTGNWPHAMVTRKDDHQWSSIVEGVQVVLIRSLQKNVTQDASLCQKRSQTENSSALLFLNAPICVGNFGEIFLRYFPVTLYNTEDKKEETGLIFSPNLGSLDRRSDTNSDERGTLREIINRTKLNCGVLNHTGNKELTAMSSIYCKAVAAAIFHGDSNAVNFTYLDSFSESLEHLKHGAFDIIAGDNLWALQGLWQSSDFSGSYLKKLYSEFGSSVPYYYATKDNGEVGRAMSLVTHLEKDAKDDVFLSFVNAVVTATIHAVINDISKESGMQMPFYEMFGEELRFMLKDVVYFVGNYDDIYDESHGDKDRGVNNVNVDSSIWQTRNVICTMVGGCDNLQSMGE